MQIFAAIKSDRHTIKCIQYISKTWFQTELDTLQIETLTKTNMVLEKGKEQER